MMRPARPVPAGHVRKREGWRGAGWRVVKTSRVLWGMARALMAQTLGSALVPGCFLVSQGAQRLLDAVPSSATAWYLNLAVFAPLQEVRAVPSLLAAFLDRAGATEFVLVLLLLATVQLARFRLGVAFLAHLAFGASLLVAQAWVTDHHGAIALGLLLTREASGTALVAILLTLTGLACALGHAAFVLAIMGDEGGARRARPERGGAPASPLVLAPATR